MRRLILFLLFFVMIGAVHAQFTYGTTGLLNMPTADMQRDKTFMFGGGFLENPEVKKEESNLKKKAPKKYQQDFDNADEAIAKNIKSGTVWYHKDVFNLLLVGSDTRNPQYYSRSDSMILISVNKRSQ